MECGRCSVDISQAFRACSVCFQSFCVGCAKLGPLKNPCTNGLAHVLLSEGQEPPRPEEVGVSPSSPTFPTLDMSRNVLSDDEDGGRAKSPLGSPPGNFTMSPTNSRRKDDKMGTFTKKKKYRKSRKDVKDLGVIKREEEEEVVCVNCKEVSEEGSMYCSLCEFVYCSSCIKLAAVGMVPCTKSSDHKFTQMQLDAPKSSRKNGQPQDIILMAEDMKKGLLNAKLCSPKLKFQSQDAIKWMAQQWEKTEAVSLKLLQTLLLNRFIYPARYTQVECYKQLHMGDTYFFQPIGEGKSFLDIKGVDWEDLQTTTFHSKSGVKVKDRWKNMRKTPHCFLGSELVDWLCSKFGIIRPVAISMGEEMMTRALFFPVDVNIFVDKAVFYTVIRESSDPSQQKLVTTLQKILNNQPVDQEMRDNISFMLRSLVQSSNSVLHRKIDAIEMISQSDEVDEQTKSYLGSHLGLSPSNPNLRKERRAASPTPSSPPLSSSSSSSSSSSGIMYPNSAAPTVLGSFVSNSLNQKHFSTTMEKLPSWNFEILTLAENVDGFPMMYIGYCIFRYFDWFNKFKIREDTLRSFLLNVESSYGKENSYHNNTHAADVTQTLFFFLTTGGLIEQHKLSSLDVFGAIVSAMLHDIDHPGRNNAFLVNTSNPLAVLYNDESVLENHHCATGFSAIRREECNILGGLTKDEYTQVRKAVISLILGTDFAKHFSILANFKDLMSSDEVDMEKNENRNLVLKVALKCADISHTTKAQHLHLAWTDRVSEEFFCQGDDEKKSGLSISPGMNREEVNVCKSQVGFLNFLALPLYQEFVQYHPGCELSLKGVQRNLKYWRNRSLCEGV